MKVKALHAKFHEVASQVLALALAGKKREALQLMSMEGEYAKVSSQLTLAMSAWSKSLAA